MKFNARNARLLPKEIMSICFACPFSGGCFSGHQMSEIPLSREKRKYDNLVFSLSIRSGAILTLENRYNLQQNRTRQVQTLLIAIFCVRFVMVGAEVAVPLVTSRMRNASAEKKRRARNKVMVAKQE